MNPHFTEKETKVPKGSETLKFSDLAQPTKRRSQNSIPFRLYCLLILCTLVGARGSRGLSSARTLLLLFSHSVVSNSLWPHGLEHTRFAWPSTSPADCSNSCPLSWGCHPTIPSSVTHFFSCLWSSPASGSFPVSRFFASGGHIIGASVSVLPMNIQGWFPLG